MGTSTTSTARSTICCTRWRARRASARRTLNKKSRIALSVAHAGMRYFANQIPDYDPHTAEHWGFGDYMTWAWTQGLRGAVRLMYFYGLLVWRLVELWYSLRGVDVERRRLVHHERLRAAVGALADRPRRSCSRSIPCAASR